MCSVGLAEPGDILLSCPYPSSMWGALGTLRVLTDGSRRAVLSDGAAWPPSPRYIPSFRAPEQAVLLGPLPNQFSGMLFLQTVALVRVFLTCIYLSLPAKGGENSLLLFLCPSSPAVMGVCFALVRHRCAPTAGLMVCALQSGRVFWV